MSALTLRVLEHVHGHVAWLSIAALLHPAILLRRRTRRAPWSAILAASTVTLAAVLGVLVYPAYRNTLKQTLFLHAPRIGWLFERKEHLAVAVLGLAWAGAVAHLTSPRFPPGDAREAVARLAHHAFLAAFVLSVVVGVLGVIVATHASF